MIFVDTNVVIDLMDLDGEGASWSVAAFADAQARYRCVVNPVVAAEIASHFADAVGLAEFLSDSGLACLDLTLQASFRAGVAHRRYRRAGGSRESILADFLIAGHAATLGVPLLTRDKCRFAAYFPELTIIAPEESNG